MTKTLFLILLVLGFQKAFSQCEFQYHIKKGGLYYFSTFYEGYDYSRSREGVCEQLANGKPYERRVFKNGILQEEFSYNFETGKPRVIFKREKKDSVIAELKMFDELNRLKLHQIFYLDKNKHRCWKEIDYNGDKLWHVRYFRNITNEEIMRAGYPTRPEHQIDSEGYSDCSGQFGPELNYHQNGELLSIKHHNFIVSDNPNYTLTQTGPYVMYSETKKLLQKGQYENGRAEGKFYYYYLDGTLSEEKEFKQDFPTGIWKGYHPSGKLMCTINYAPEFYFSTGHETRYFENGVVSYEKRIDQQGKGFEKKFNEMGINTESKIFNYFPHEYVSHYTYYDSGKMKSKQYFRAQNDTLMATYFEDGSIQRLNMNFKASGVAESWEYSQKDILLRHTKTQAKSDSAFTFLEEYDNQGRLKHEFSALNGIYNDTFYWTTGNKKEEYRKSSGLLDGNYCRWDSLGSLLESCTYKNGFRIQPCALSKEQVFKEISREEKAQLRHEVLKYFVGKQRQSDSSHISEVEIKQTEHLLSKVYQFHLANGSAFHFKNEKTEDQFTYVFTLPVHSFLNKEPQLDSLLKSLHFEKISRKDYNAHYFAIECKNNELYTLAELDEAFLIFKLADPVSHQLQITPLAMHNFIDYDWGRYPNELTFQIKREELGTLVTINQNYGSNTFVVYENGYVEFLNLTGNFNYSPDFPFKGYQW
jgi:antitoxin component YwqK of YwqJK toxin-antitoxin module